ncbi:MAG: VWA domain-containing protein [Planctomycetaceae bacterium]|nr:VWA domain-containing protein [Planctomycetaceae bacterium]
MSFIHLSLLSIGGLFLVLPVALHLAMRQKPRHQVFPAIRFLQARQTTNKRRLQLRQWLLLMLRCLVVLLLALALARPSVASAHLGQWLAVGIQLLLLLLFVCVTLAVFAYRRGPLLVGTLLLLNLILIVSLANSAWAIARGSAPLMLGDSQAPVAAVVLIDTSPRMAYRHQNRTRLEDAKEMAKWLVLQLPVDSDVAIIESRPNTAVFAVDSGAAVKAVDAIQVDYQPQAWGQLLKDALQLLDQSEHERKELYVVSDLTAETWDDAVKGSFASDLAAADNVTLQVIDVGVAESRNDAIVALELSEEMVPAGSPINIRANIRRSGPAGRCTLKLFVESEDGKDPIIVDGELQLPETTMRGKQTIDLAKDSSSWASFALSSLPMGTHHGYLEIDGEDGLEIDNRRYFTVHVRPAWRVLVVAPDDVDSDFLTSVLSPRGFRSAKFDCTEVSQLKLKDQRLQDFAAVAILDPTPLGSEQWDKLKRYVESGGGLALFLGRNAQSAERFNSDAAADIMPGKIQRQWRDENGVFYAPREFDHPMMSLFRDIRSTVPWQSMPIFRHWVIEQLAEDASVIVPFSNNKPAIVERLIGAGRMVLVTTPVSEADSPGIAGWNQVLNSPDPWPFVMLLDRLFLYLVQSQDAPLNYEVGQIAQLAAPNTKDQRWPLLTPRGDWQEVTSNDGTIRVAFTEDSGTYRLKASEAADTARGFSVNLNEQATQLDRITRERLDETLGVDRFRLARERDEIVREIDQARIGREFYPFLLPVLVLILALEFVLSNRFYANG